MDADGRAQEGIADSAELRAAGGRGPHHRYAGAAPSDVSSDDVMVSVSNTNSPATTNGAPAAMGTATREMPPYVCCTPICSPRSFFATTRDSRDVTHGNRNAVPSGM